LALIISLSGGRLSICGYDYYKICDVEISVNNFIGSQTAFFGISVGRAGERIIPSIHGMEYAPL
jgi:hypothetical protein